MKLFYTPFIVFVFFSNLKTYAQITDAWVYFKDKPKSDYYISNPHLILSDKAIERRHKEGVEINDEDVPVEKNYLDVLKSKSGLQVFAVSKWLNCAHIRGSESEIEALLVLDFVKNIEWANQSHFNTGMNLKLQDYKFSENFKMSNTDKVTDNQIEMLSGNVLHDIGFKGEGVIIGVLDSGFYQTNQIDAFKHLYDGNTENGEVLTGFSMLPQNRDVYGDIGAQHGLMVLSSMAGLSDDFSGTAPHASYVIANTEDPDNENPVEESWWVQAAEKMDSIGVDIINTSLGYSTFDNSLYNYSYEDMNGQNSFISRGAKIAAQKGIFLVTSAGNAGNNSWKYITTPADVEEALTVGAVDGNRQIVSFSSYGPSATNKVKPEVLAQGHLSYVYNQSGELQRVFGTSFSSPITAGLVGCLIQAFPNLKRASLKDYIVQSASNYPNYGNQTGYGIPNFSLAYENIRSNYELTQNEFQLFYENDLGHFVVQSSNCQCIKGVKVYNMLGQLVFSQSNTLLKSSVSFQATHLNQGIYILVVEKESSEFRLRFIKNE